MDILGGSLESIQATPWEHHSLGKLQVRTKEAATMQNKMSYINFLSEPPILFRGIMSA